MFHRDIETPRKGLSIFDEIRGVLIADETQPRVFGIDRFHCHAVKINKWKTIQSIKPRNCDPIENK